MSFEAMAWAVKKDLPAAKKCLLLIIANNASEEGWFYHSYSKLAKGAGLSKRSVINYMREFEEQGLINKQVRQRNNGSFTTNEWWLNMEDSEIPAPGSEPPAPGNSELDTPSGESLALSNPPCGESPAPLKTINQSNKTKKNKYTSEDYELAKRMLTQVQEQFPSTEADLDVWADAIRKLREVDEQSREQIIGLWLWVRNHHFWYKNIKSPLKLRGRDKDGTRWWDRLNNERNLNNAPRKSDCSQSEFDDHDTSWYSGNRTGY